MTTTKHKIFLASLFLILNVHLVYSQYETAPTQSKYTVKDSSGLGNDGPYIFYTQEGLISKSIQKVDGKYEIITDTLPYNQRHIEIKRDHPSKPSFHLKLAHRHRKAKTHLPAVDSIFVISDIEGNFDALEKLLVSSGVTDTSFKWTFGTGHLVILGDVFDRGLEVTQCLWLIYKLEQEAPEGHVHFVIGNHESINFMGFIEYVRNKYRLVSYAFAMEIGQMNSKQTVLGNWLRKKNMTLKIGEHLFVHGGISPAMAEAKLSLKKINKYGRKNYDTPKPKNKAKLVFGAQGPMWYRGYFDGQKGHYQQITDITLQKTLDFYGAKNVIVGHTIVPFIAPRYNNKLYPVDVSHRDNLEKGNPTQGLIIKGTQFFRHYTNGKRIILQQ